MISTECSTVTVKQLEKILKGLPSNKVKCKGPKAPLSYVGWHFISLGYNLKTMNIYLVLETFENKTAVHAFDSAGKQEEHFTKLVSDYGFDVSDVDFDNRGIELEDGVKIDLVETVLSWLFIILGYTLRTMKIKVILDQEQHEFLNTVLESQKHEVGVSRDPILVKYIDDLIKTLNKENFFVEKLPDHLKPWFDFL